MNTNPEVRILTKGLDPVKLLSIMSPFDYENLIEEWASSYLKDKCKKYSRVEKLGGPGDMGRDVVCTDISDNNIWDNYQCKHYEDKLSPSNIWLELGKICYYSFKNSITVPRYSTFVAPKGVTTKLRDLLNDSANLKAGLFENWDKHCKKKITITEEVELESKLRTYINNFDFSIFKYLSPKEFIEQVQETPYYSKYFGALKKPRPISVCPDEIKDMEMAYIQKIIEAYSEYLQVNIKAREELDKHPELREHFKRQRRNFYEAQTLKEFSRDIHDPKLEYFEKFIDDIYESIIEEIAMDAKHGYQRLQNVLKRVENIQVVGNPLTCEVSTKDRHGMCHHLANERDDIKWVK